MIRIAMPVLAFMTSASVLMVMMIVVSVVMLGLTDVRFVPTSTDRGCVRSEMFMPAMSMSDVPISM
jgi:hypothetical protein